MYCHQCQTPICVRLILDVNNMLKLELKQKASIFLLKNTPVLTIWLYVNPMDVAANTNPYLYKVNPALFRFTCLAGSD